MRVLAQGLGQAMQFLFQHESFCNNSMSEHNFYWLRSNESLLGKKNICTMDKWFALSLFLYVQLKSFESVILLFTLWHFPLSTASRPSVDWHEWLNATGKSHLPFPAKVHGSDLLRPCLLLLAGAAFQAATVFLPLMQCSQPAYSAITGASYQQDEEVAGSRSFE